MIKISALNEETEEESGSEEEVTREASEQIALQQYANALDLQRKGNLKDATQLLRDLLDTELLYDVKKPAEGEKVPGPLFNLKYLSYKNLATMLSASEEIDAAIEAYCAASELDDTDVTLWHRLGQLCLRAKRYEMALHAFQRGADINPRHWPCLDKIVTLLLGLDYKEECISTIHDALKLDPDYLRGLAYRKHIFTVYPYIKDFMEYLDPIYKWDEKDDEPFDEEKGEKLIKEAEEIHESFLEQQRAEEFKYVIPELKLVKPITNLNWLSVGDSLVKMHHYMSENFYSHACPIEIIFEKEEVEEKMEVCEEPPETEPVENKTEEVENKTDVEMKIDNLSGNENNDLSDKDKAATDTEKVESDVEAPPEAEQPEHKVPKKTPVRRRGSALSFLQQWEWCTKRRSGRKKPVNKQDQDDNIYETLRKMVPICLVPEMVEKKENQARETSPDISDLDKLFDEKDKPEEAKEYFGSETEAQDVKSFINKYTENKRDIIDILKDFLSTLAVKWGEKWPQGLPEVFIEANKCYMNHIDVPTYTSDNNEDLLHYTTVNILVEEFTVNEQLNTSTDDKQQHDLSVIESIGITLSLKPHIFVSTECMELTLRYLWVKLHIHMLNKCNEFALDCLYQLQYEFEAMEEHHDTYSLNVINFTFKPKVNEKEVLAGIKFLERNKKLSTVMDSYERGNYEDVLSVVIDSFEHCKSMARNDEEMALDFAVQLALILDTYWALDKPDDCFKWSLTCLHEALKHYFRYTSGSVEYDKWNLTVVKILCCMEHILTTEGLTCLDAVSQKELSQGLEDLIRVIGHQVETNASEMPFGTVIPWIIMHYILQREEDQGSARVDKDKVANEEVPNPIMLLFIAHEQLGKRGWCCKSEGKLLYFTLDIVVPRLRSPALAKALEQVCENMEQCVYCLFGHPGRKNKVKYLIDHNASHPKPFELDWVRAQQLYEIFRPPTLPALEGKVTGITADTEQLFQRILKLLPAECDPQKYLPDIEKYIKGIEDKLPSIPSLLPYKMKDIYFLLGDYYYKKEERKLGVKFNMLDVAVNNDRVESWARISLAKALNLDTILNSCKNLNHEKEYLNPAKSVIRCFKRSLELDPKACNMWTEYGMFVYSVHSFCSRVLKQASESLSMEDFESLEQQKEDMLSTTHKCFITVLNELNNSPDIVNDEPWLHYYMLGKVAEKRNKPPSVYLDFYMKAVKSLQETDATYPLKINYNSPTHLCIEVLELHYRIHASILKFIEQHESKPIPASVGKVFSTCIEEWKKGPFTKKPKKDGVIETETNTEPKPTEPVHAANILKRSISDAGEEESHEAKRLKMEAAAAKVRRSASYDTERVPKDPAAPSADVAPAKEVAPAEEKKPDVIIIDEDSPRPAPLALPAPLPPPEPVVEKAPEIEKLVEEKEEKKSDAEQKEGSSSSTSATSSSDSSSTESSSDSSNSSSSSDSSTSTKSANDAKALPEDEIMKIVAACLDALEDCASRFSPHYKAIYRLAHYHFYYKKGKDIERCRDLMLSNFMSRAGQKLGGLFSEKKPSNFFNNIWKIPLMEIERPGGFIFHMNRSVLLTMEILKEIDDHKTLLDLSLHLIRIPEPDKKYLRDSDREELAQQAFSLCVQSLRGQLTKFSQQADLKSNDVERQALNSLMLDIYRAYQRAQKQPNSKQFTNLLIEGYKLVTNDMITENMNLTDISMKYCQRLIQKLKQEATMASLDKSQNAQKKQAAKAAAVAERTEPVKPPPVAVHPPSKPEAKPPPPPPQPSASTSSSTLPKMSPHEMAAAFQSYLPMLNDPLLSQQTAAALSLSYLSNISALAGYPSLQNTLQSSLQSTLQNTFQAEFYRQFIGQSFSSFMPPVKKQKRGPKPGSTRAAPVSQMKTSKSFSGSMPTTMTSVSKPSMSSASKPAMTSVNKPAPTSTISSLQKSNSTPLTPSMGTVLQNLPASMTANLSNFGAMHSTSHTTHTLPAQAHMSTASTVSAAIHTKPPMPHQQVSPGKTLQEKLAERQKHLPISKNHDINASISKLPSSLTITKTSVPKPKKPDAKKALPFTDRPKPISSDEVIVLDDD
ncbi:unnamed protein product [Chrysodeixis includens]|uniref:Calcineurin-binding protein cabin-1 n=1 Tax=Chrysodeixis includens TaxID=689277 RepID=A0A9P0FWD7_CHRIL|nr:unnamed protein product [Chrysodeixis includens]